MTEAQGERLLCGCGCGGLTEFAPRIDKRVGVVKGQPQRYIRNHFGPKPGPEGERFWGKVDKSAGPDECWLWTGGVDISGYGKFYRARVAPQRHAPITKAHRYAYETLVGPIPEGLFLLHSCDNPPCVNPAHLRPGTHAENMADMVRRGRSTKGRQTRKAS